MEGLYRGNFLTHKVQYNPLIHISKAYLSLQQTIRTEAKSIPELEEKIEDEDISLPKFIPSQGAKRQMWAKLKEFNINEGARLLLINPGEGNIPLREWPLENFIILAKRILESEKKYIIIVGTQEAFHKSGLLQSAINNKRYVDLTGKTTLFELLTLFNIAGLLVANDSGLTHLASLTSVKKFVLFGPENPQIYAPLGVNTWIIYSDLFCSPCLSAFNHRKSTCRDNECLKMIEPDEVYGLIEVNL